MADIYKRKKFEDTCAGKNAKAAPQRKVRNNWLMQLGCIDDPKIPKNVDVSKFNTDDERDWLEKWS